MKSGASRQGCMQGNVNFRVGRKSSSCIENGLCSHGEYRQGKEINFVTRNVLMVEQNKEECFEADLGRRNNNEGGIGRQGHKFPLRNHHFFSYGFFLGFWVLSVNFKIYTQFHLVNATCCEISIVHN